MGLCFGISAERYADLIASLNSIYIFKADNLLPTGIYCDFVIFLNYKNLEDQLKNVTKIQPRYSEKRNLKIKKN